MLNLSALFVMVALMLSCGRQDKKAQGYHLEFYQSGNIRIGILPEVGGRIVHLGLIGRENIFKQDTVLWREHPAEKPLMNFVNGYKPYHGHVVWPAPMSQWWQHQDLYPDKKQLGARWPPDPYLDYAAYDLSQSGGTFRLQGPASPISGIRMVKTIEIISSNAVLFEVMAENVTRARKGLALWLNTRLPGTCKCYVPVASALDARYKKSASAEQDTLRTLIRDGFFTFVSDSTGSKKKLAVTKAYIYPAKPYMAAFNRDQVIIIRFPHHNKEDIHIEHALVEIFQQRSKLANEDLLELEYQSAFQDMAPGETIQTREIWHVFPYSGDDKFNAHVAFLSAMESRLTPAI